MTTMTCKGYGNSKFDIIKCKSKWILNIFYSCFTHAKALDVSHHVMLCCWFSHDSNSEASEASPTNLFQSEHWVIMNLSRVYHDMSRTLSNIIEQGCRREWKIDSSFLRTLCVLLFLTSTQLFTAAARTTMIVEVSNISHDMCFAFTRDAMTNSKLPSAHLTRRHHQHHQFVVRMWASQNNSSEQLKTKHIMTWGCSRSRYMCAHLRLTLQLRAYRCSRAADGKYHNLCSLMSTAW